MIAYMSHSRPFVEPKMNSQEIFNELCILVSSYLLLYFTDWTNSVAFRFDIGWGHVSLLGFNVFINFSFMALEQLRTVKLRCKRRSNKKKAKKRGEERMRELEAENARQADIAR